MHEIFFENLRNPARIRRAGLLRQFRAGQVYSASTSSKFSKISRSIPDTAVLFISIIKFPSRPALRFYFSTTYS
jgi:hypothetical protein